MARNLFSVPIFFVVFRATLEAAIILSVLFALVEQIIAQDNYSPVNTALVRDSSDEKDGHPNNTPNAERSPSDNDLNARRRLLRKLRIQISLGAGLGLLISLAIGAAFIAVWFTKASDLWSESKDVWQGIFDLVASFMIFVVGVAMLNMDRAKWRLGLARAFDGKGADASARTGRWLLVVLPLVTVLREGLGAIDYVGGVSLGQPATSIPIATIVGLVCGFVCGFFIYKFASRATSTIFLVATANLLFLIGAGLFTRSVSAFQTHAFDQLVGMDVADAAGDGPGSYDVRGNVWHLDCCNPMNKLEAGGWSILAIFGWTNSATVGSVLAYVFYWLAVVVVLMSKKSRTRFPGYTFTRRTRL